MIQEESQSQSVVKGRTIKKRFYAALLSGVIFLGALFAVFGITGTAYAVPIGGFGNFSVKFDKLVGQGFKMYGGLSESGNSDKTPILVNEINKVTITNLHIMKDITIPGLGNYRIHITAKNPVTIDGLVQKAKVVRGDAVFGNMDISEKNTQNYSQQFSQGADTITLKNGDLDTTYLFQKTVSLPGLRVYFEKLK